MEGDYEVIFFMYPQRFAWTGERRGKRRPSNRFRRIGSKAGALLSPWTNEAPTLAFQRRGRGRRRGGGGEIVEGLHRKGVTRVFARPLVPQHLNLHSHRGLVLKVGRVEPVIRQGAVLGEGGSVVGEGEWLVSHEEADGFLPHFSQVLHNGIDLRFHRHHQEAVGRGVGFIGPGPEQGGQGGVGGGGEADSQRPVAPRRRVGKGMSIYLANKPDDCLRRLNVGSPLVAELVIGKNLDPLVVGRVQISNVVRELRHGIFPFGARSGSSGIVRKRVGWRRRRSHGDGVEVEWCRYI
jgi:hypothetical protein